MAKASSMRWYGYVLTKEDENVAAKALKFEVPVVEEKDDQNKLGKNK